MVTSTNSSSVSRNDGQQRVAKSAGRRRMLTGNAAAAWAVRLADVDYVPAFPITPQTEIIEKLSGWFGDQTIEGKFITLDSEHSMITAAGSAAATGCRVFTATSSQGLLYGLEALYTVAGWRVPFVMVNVSRGLSAPITLEPDHNDILAARDTGCVQLHAETCQEVLDSILMAYHIAEDPRVQLPVIVNMDGFYLSYTREPVEIPSVEQVKEFLPALVPQHAQFCASEPRAQGVAVLGGQVYSHFRYQMHLAASNALEVHREVAQDFAEHFGRQYDELDRFLLDDADEVIVMAGSFATKGKAAVEALRQEGRRAGLLRLRMIRPLPMDAIRNALAGRRRVAVLDQNIAPGLGGILFQEVAAALYNHPDRPEVLLSFVGGLGGKDISMEEFQHIFESLKDADPGRNSAGSELLYTSEDWQKTNSLIGLALPNASQEPQRPTAPPVGSRAPEAGRKGRRR